MRDIKKEILDILDKEKPTKQDLNKIENFKSWIESKKFISFEGSISIYFLNLFLKEKRGIIK